MDILAKSVKNLNSDNIKSQWQAKIEIGLDISIIFVVLIKYILKLFCSRQVSYGMLIIWIAIEIFIVQALCLVRFFFISMYWWLALSGLLLCVSSSGMLLIYTTLE